MYLSVLIVHILRNFIDLKEIWYSRSTLKFFFLVHIGLLNTCMNIFLSYRINL